VNEGSAVIRLAILLVRPGVVMAFAPGLGGSFVPSRAKVALTVMMAIGLLPVVTVPQSPDALTLTGVIAREAAIGLALAAAMQALVAGVELAGHLSGYQIGYSYAATIDPMTGARNNTVSALFGLVALLTLLSVNGHHLVLRALAASYEGLPIGAGAVGASLATRVQDLLGMVFTVGTRLAAPIVIVMLVVEVAVGLISRTAPSLGFMVVGYPIRLALGLFVLATVVSAIPGVVDRMVDTAVRLGASTAAAFR
jgi:flagellar biosynthetic protein FliR